jgi:hypothetical protein
LTRTRSVDIPLAAELLETRAEAGSGVAVTSEILTGAARRLLLQSCQCHSQRRRPSPIVTMLDALVYSASLSFTARLS